MLNRIYLPAHIFLKPVPKFALRTVAVAATATVSDSDVVLKKIGKQMHDVAGLRLVLALDCRRFITLSSGATDTFFALLHFVNNMLLSYVIAAANA